MAPARILTLARVTCIVREKSFGLGGFDGLLVKGGSVFIEF